MNKRRGMKKRGRMEERRKEGRGKEKRKEKKQARKKGRQEGRKEGRKEVPIVVQQLTNPTSIHEDAALIPGLAQWVEDLALP